MKIRFVVAVLVWVALTHLSLAHADPMANWIPFHGTATEQGRSVRLNGAGGGSFDIDKQYVRGSASQIEVKVGVPATVVHKTSLLEGILDPTPALAGDCHQQDDCPTHCASCIGLVRVCCGGGGTRGVCLGVWGCP